ncbi:MAG: hypothetical protein BGO34_09760 [Bacteroidia bacterium 44-10]|nr:MAG: hypothetical protein BGO34_09760 [Bacteroidia bacterium 44-10]
MKFENRKNRICGYGRRHIFSSVLLVAFLAVFSFTLHAQDSDNMEFWFVAPDAAQSHSDRPTFLMITAGDKEATVTISMPKNLRFRETFTQNGDTVHHLNPNESWKFELIGDSVEIFENSYESSGMVTNKGVLITSTNPVSAYYQIDGINQKEIITLKGKKALGNDFYMPFQTDYEVSNRSNYNNEQYRQIQIVATEDGTVVTIHPKSENAKFSVPEGTGGTYECKQVPLVSPTGTIELCYHYINSASDESVRKRTLQKGETLLWREAIRNTPDLTGTRIHADKPVAITYFEDCMDDGKNGSVDPIGDQMVPVDKLGQNYIVVKGYSSGNTKDHVLVLAVEDNTDVWWGYLDANNVKQETKLTTTKPLSKGESLSKDLGIGDAFPGASYIRTNNAVYCLHQSATGNELGGAILPSLYSISAKKIAFIKGADSYERNSMFLIFREAAQNGFKMNEKTFQELGTQYNPQRIGFDDWMYAKVDIKSVVPINDDRVCVVDNSSPFALGYFVGSPSPTALYGYLSSFGTFSFEGDTIYACHSHTFEPPYALKYDWITPEGPSSAPILTATKSGQYILEVDQDPHKLIDTTYLKVQNFNHELNVPQKLLVDKSYNFSILLNPDNHPDNRFNAKYEWTFQDEDASVNTSNEREIKVSFTEAGTKTISLHLWNYANYPNFEGYQAICDTVIDFSLEVLATPAVMYWKSDAKDHNWNNEENWVDAEGNSLSVVPSAYTKVYLPGNAGNYPSLKDEPEGHTDWAHYGRPEVNEIVFRYGSELHYQHKLQYNKAYVNYNWGYYDNGFTEGQPTHTLENGKKLPRDTWHMLAAPLKSMASGDFSLAGYPFSWQQQFRITTTGVVTEGGFSKPFSTNDVRLTDNNNAIAIKMASYKNETGYLQKYLEGLNGVIEIPYFENKDVTSWYPAHNYDVLSRKSYFYYFDTKTLRIINSPVGMMPRAGEAYRFVYETEQGNPPENGMYVMDVEVKGDDLEVMVGNPFLAPLDADAFAGMNRENIVSGEGFKLLSEDGTIWEQHWFEEGDTIPAWKAFIVTLQPGKNSLSFEVEAPTGMSTAFRASYTPGPSDDALYVQVLKGGARSGDAARLQRNRLTDKPDIRKMILPEGHQAPEIFFISSGGDLSYLVMNLAQGENEVAIGVKTSDTRSPLTLQFKNVHAFAASTGTKAILVDKHLNVRQDLTINPTYRFTQQASGLDNQYVDKHRFVLQLSGESGISEQEDAPKGIEVIYRSGILKVTSDENIDTISVYDLYGRPVFSARAVNLSQYIHPVTLQGKQLFLVRVKTVSGKETTRKIMAN